MAENLEAGSFNQVEPRIEEKEHEVVSHDEFGELGSGNVQSSQAPQDSQENSLINQERADDRNQQLQNRENNNQVQVGNRTDPQENMRSSLSQGNPGANRGENIAPGGRGSYRGAGGRGRGGFEGAYGNNQGGNDGVGGYGRYHEHQGRFNNGPYDGAGGRQPNFNRGPSLFDLIPRRQNYVSEVLRPLNLGHYQYPTPTTSPFARAMSQITCNPTSANQGTVGELKVINREMFEQLQMALTVQLGLNGPQQVKERALHNVLASSAARADLKQILQSRAELYGDELDPKWFQTAVDLGKKASTIKARNQARSQLAGAPLLVAQVTELEFRRKLQEGDNNLAQNLNLGT